VNENRSSINMGIPFYPMPITTFDGRGGYWCTLNDGYVIVRRLVGGRDTATVIRQSLPRVPVSAAERAAALERVRIGLAPYQKKEADLRLVPSVYPVFERLIVDDQERLWAQRVVPKGAPSAFDLYDVSGRRVATVTTPVRFAAYRPVVIVGDAVYGVALDSDDVQYVVRARIVR
jgi:hypothetical protein